MFTTKQKGFTLIELLVVIAIISLLVSILLPSLKRAKELAQRSACAINQRGMVMAALLYTNDFDGLTALGWQEPNTFTNGWLGDNNNFLQKIYPYTGENLGLFVCPSALPASGIYTPVGKSQCSYAANYIVTAYTNTHGTPLELIPNPSGIVYFADMNSTRQSISYHARNTAAGINGVPVVDEDYGPYCVHENGMNLGFVDSHTERVEAGVPSNGIWGMTPDDHISTMIVLGGHLRAF